LRIAYILPHTTSIYVPPVERTVLEGELSVIHTRHFNLISSMQTKYQDNIKFFYFTDFSKTWSINYNGVNIIFCPLFRKIPFIKFQYSLELIRELINFKPDIIHIFGLYKKSLFLHLLYSKFSNSKIIAEYTSSSISKKVVKRMIQKFILCHINKIIVWDRDELFSLLNNVKIQKERLLINPTIGVDISKFYKINKDISREKLNLSTNLNYLLYIGRIPPRGSIKDPFTLIDILKFLRDIDIRLIIVGSGKGKNKLIQYAKQNNVYDRVIFFPWQRNNQLINFYNAADIFIFPMQISVSGGWGTVIGEAMACELPIVSFGTDVSEDDDCIIFVDRDDFLSIKSSILSLLNNNDYQRKLIRNSKRKIEKILNWNAIITVLHDEYNSILEE